MFLASCTVTMFIFDKDQLLIYQKGLSYNSDVPNFSADP